MHAFYYLSQILLTHSLYLGVVLSALVTPPPLTTHLIIFYVVDFAFLSWTTTLCPRKSFSFTRSSCTSVILICSPQLHYWQLLLMTDVSQSAASLLLAPSLREAPDFCSHFLFAAALLYRCSKVTFSWSTASWRFPGLSAPPRLNTCRNSLRKIADNAIQQGE